MKPLALALLIAVAIPSVAADHVYSHRYLIEGRLVGSDGAPLPGRDVAFVGENVSFSEACRDGGHRSITDENGDFRFCFHTHDLPPNGRVGARSGDAGAMVALDPTVRRSTLTLRDERAPGVEPAGWNESYRVGGRVWRVGPTELENVRVYGAAIAHVPVNLTVHTADGSETRFETETDAYGDFDLVVTTAADPSTVTLTVEALGVGQPAALDAASHRTSLTLFLPAETEASAYPAGTAFVPQPGTLTPRASPVLVVAVVAGLALSVGLARRKAR